MAAAGTTGENSTSGVEAPAAGRGLAKLAGFKAEDVVPKTDRLQALEESVATRSKQRELLKTLTKTVKKEKRKSEKLKKKALALSSSDLCEIIGMKQHLASQYEAKQSAMENNNSAGSE